MTGVPSHRAGVATLNHLRPPEHADHPAYYGELATDVPTLAEHLRQPVMPTTSLASGTLVIPRKACRSPAVLTAALSLMRRERITGRSALIFRNMIRRTGLKAVSEAPCPMTSIHRSSWSTR
jgi:hypothetical protein